MSAANGSQEAVESTSERGAELWDQALGRLRHLVRMSIRLPDGDEGVIHIFEGDDPHELAEAFCGKYGLEGTQLVGVIEERIAENMPKPPPKPEGASMWGKVREAGGDPAEGKQVKHAFSFGAFAGNLAGKSPLRATSMGGARTDERGAASLDGSDDERAAPRTDGLRRRYNSDGDLPSLSPRDDYDEVRYDGLYMARQYALRWRDIAHDRASLRWHFRALAGHVQLVKMARGDPHIHTLEKELEQLKETTARVARLVFYQARAVQSSP